MTRHMPLPSWISSNGGTCRPALYQIVRHQIRNLASVGSAGLGVLPNPRSASVEVARGVARYDGYCGRRVARLAYRPEVDKRRAKRDLGWRIGEPTALFGIIEGLAVLELFLERAVLLRERPGIVTSIVIDAVRYVLLAWFVAAVIAGVEKCHGAVVCIKRREPGCRPHPALFRILSITGALLVLVHAAAEFGIGITPIIAGLGVGGLAVALAIRPILENIMGGFVLFAYKPGPIATGDSWSINFPGHRRPWGRLPRPVLGPASWIRRHPVPHASRTDPCDKAAAGPTTREIAT